MSSVSNPVVSSSLNDAFWNGLSPVREGKRGAPPVLDHELAELSPLKDLSFEAPQDLALHPRKRIKFAGKNVNQVFIDSILAEKWEEAKCVKRQGANVNSPEGSSAFYQAVLLGHVRAVSILIHAGIDIHQKNGEGKTAYNVALECREKAKKEGYRSMALALDLSHVIRLVKQKKDERTIG